MYIYLQRFGTVEYGVLTSLNGLYTLKTFSPAYVNPILNRNTGTDLITLIINLSLGGA